MCEHELTREFAPRRARARPRRARPSSTPLRRSHDTRALNVTVHTCVHSTPGRADPGRLTRVRRGRGCSTAKSLTKSYSGIPSSYHRQLPPMSPMTAPGGGAAPLRRRARTCRRSAVRAQDPCTGSNKHTDRGRAPLSPVRGWALRVVDSSRKECECPGHASRAMPTALDCPATTRR